MDDTEAADFIHTSFGRDVHGVYSSLPLGVMRADFWRYAALYRYGGIYADIDTRCLVPIEQWFPPRGMQHNDPVFVVNASTWQSAGTVQYFNLTWSDCGLVAALENDAHMCQWIIASVPGHPVLRAALTAVLRSMKGGVNCMDDHMVHKHTGPGVWTEAFRDVLGLSSGASAADIARATWTNATVYERARRLRLCIVASTFWGTSKPQNAQNLYSSQWSDDETNQSWLKEKMMMKASLAKSTGAAQKAVL